MISQERLVEGLAQMLATNEVQWTWLVQHGLTPHTEVELDFAYMAPSKEKAVALAQCLRQECGYRVELASAGSFLSRQWGVEGKTHKARITLDILNDWVTWMVTAGARFDCEFDGWGTHAPGP